MLKDFKEFAFKGNLVDMAVGFIMGTAFATVVKSLVDNVIMPPLGLLLADIDFTDLKYVLKEGTPGVEAVEATETAEAVAAVAEVPEVAIYYGQWISDFVAFAMLAFVVFILVMMVNKAMKKKEEEEKEEAPPAQEVLLGEIRDILKK